jgi:methylated-DNA-[protein]-cysteine S-methyltransferase
MNSYTILKTKHLGDLLLVANPTHLVGVYFQGKKHAPAVPTAWTRNPGHQVLQQATEELQEYLAGERMEFSVPVHAAGTAFQEEVWRQIARIPFGETIAYSELAQRTGAADAARAAGMATGRNPISVIIPCHRVIGKDGAITGYAGGLDRKRHLLQIEGKKFSLASAAAAGAIEG